MSNDLVNSENCDEEGEGRAKHRQSPCPAREHQLQLYANDPQLQSATDKQMQLCASEQQSRSFACSRCSAVFAHASTLAAHELTHLLPFPCSQCRLAFSKLSRLKRHERRIHTGVTDPHPFTCSYCSKAFSTRAAFRVHKLSHVVGRAFTCACCGAAFHGWTAFEAHRSSHGEKNSSFHCRLCRRVFSTFEGFRCHNVLMGRHHRRACDDCNKTNPHRCRECKTTSD